MDRQAQPPHAIPGLPAARRAAQMAQVQDAVERMDMTRPAHMRAKYSEETRAMAIALRKEGKLTCREIGMKLGISKNAVVGLCARAGLSDPANNPIKRTKPAPPPQRLKPIVRKPVPKPRRLKPGERRCLWPQVDPERDAETCEAAAITVDGRQMPYCKAHCKRAYIGGSARR